MSEKAIEIPSDYLEILRNSGGRVTPIVTKLLQILHSCRKIYTPQQIKDELSKTLSCDISFTTIYRAIDRLTQCQLIHRMYRDDGQTMFYVCNKPYKKHHHHFICTECNRVYDFDLCLLHEYESHASKYMDATVTNHIIQLEGICKSCRS